MYVIAITCTAKAGGASNWRATNPLGRHGARCVMSVTDRSVPML
jgi:hypothetical protein